MLDELFQRIFDSPPNRWQREAFDAFVESRVPRCIKVPTAGGKTAILVVFLAALAVQARTGKVTLPRRLVLVVNRRVLVDQTSGLAELLLHLLTTNAVPRVSEALRSLSPRHVPLAVSTLRGALADNGEWSLDPATPAIILGTPDMIGSRLLFRGYGLGRSRAATHAGLLGVDTLIVHDEAHLAPAFSSVLREIEVLARPSAEKVGRTPLHVLEMTATLDPRYIPADVLACDVSGDPALAKRLRAPKVLTLVDVSGIEAKGKPAVRIQDEFTRRALAYANLNQAVVLFVHRPDNAALLMGRLLAAGIPSARIATLTGTQRGWEREQLTESAAFCRFLPSRPRTDPPAPTAYLICTSAGEIGLDIDADVGLLDLVPLDRQIQRAGRVNRRGVGRGELVLIHAQGGEIDGPLYAPSQVGIELLATLPCAAGGHDAGPLALNQLTEHPRYIEAVPPLPPRRSLELSILMQWAMTTYRLDALRVPAPDLFLHALDEEECDVDLVWRILPADTTRLADWFEAWPVLRHERAKMPVGKALDHLLKVLWLRGRDVSDPPAVFAVLDGQGRLIDDAVFNGQSDLQLILSSVKPGRTIIIHSELGGLSSTGLPDGNSSEPVADVSTATRGRLLTLICTLEFATGETLWSDGQHAAPELAALIELVCPAHEVVFAETVDAPAADLVGDNEASSSHQVRVWVQALGVANPDAGDVASIARSDRALAEHLELAQKAAHTIVERLPLAPGLAPLVTSAAAQHDLGKCQARWQAALGNPDPSRPLAKSRRAAFDWRLNAGYRHELGSVLDLDDDVDELERHLVAAHHGWARPGFSRQACTQPGCQEAADKIAKSFAKLNERFGIWGLAYLEAVVKSADILAELEAERLVGQPVLTADRVAPTATAVDAVPVVVIPADPRNFGEYLACLGILAVITHVRPGVSAAWFSDGFQLIGAVDTDILVAVDQVVNLRAVVDAPALRPSLLDAKFPPLRIILGGGLSLPLNSWLAPDFSGNSAWKLSAGQTEAAKILAGLCAAGRHLRRQLTAPASLFQVGTTMRERFRFDAGTSWSALDAGFSLNEDDRFGTVRVYVELFSILGVQHAFPPPGDRAPFRYYTWTHPLPASLCLAAAKGLLPYPLQGWTPRLVPSGHMKDVFTSELTLSYEERTWLPTHLIL